MTLSVLRPDVYNYIYNLITNILGNEASFCVSYNVVNIDDIMPIIIEVGRGTYGSPYDPLPYSSLRSPGEHKT